MYDRIRNILSNQLNASIMLQEAVIAYYSTHPDEIERAKTRLEEGIDDESNVQRDHS